MSGNARESMRTYWDEAARTKAARYVDTSLSFASPHLDHFFETGRRVVAAALDEAKVVPPGRSLAVEIGSGLGPVCRAPTPWASTRRMPRHGR